MIALSRFRSRVRQSLSGLILATLTACAASAPPTVAQQQNASMQPTNVGDTKIAATAYRASGAYERDLAGIGSEADAWIAQRAPQVNRPALVLDIDDTALSNWEVIEANDFGRVVDGPCDALPAGPCGWAAWDMLGRDPAIGSTLSTFRRARALNVAVFFITGRPEPQRAATEANLRAVGYDGYAAIDMVPEGAHYASAADFKAPQRAAIESAGYTIIANIGDQPSDLAGGYAEKIFLLPNPFYRIP
jgi:predicted secreted acid phosphatase